MQALLKAELEVGGGGVRGGGANKGLSQNRSAWLNLEVC